MNYTYRTPIEVQPSRHSGPPLSILLVGSLRRTGLDEPATDKPAD
ncbi:hypothetical protein [Spirosoma liriopis]|nr:hypothetical protein [Spirosoma liriopis]